MSQSSDPEASEGREGSFASLSSACFQPECGVSPTFRVDWLEVGPVHGQLVACALLKLGLTNLLWRSGAEEDITGSLVFPVLDNDISIYEQVGLSAECGLY